MANLFVLREQPRKALWNNARISATKFSANDLGTLGVLRTPASEEELTAEEASRLHQLEGEIEAGLEGFLKVGAALAEIRSSRLYCGTHGSFESYCRDRWSLSMSRCTQLISTVKVYDNIVTVFPQDAKMLSENFNEHALRLLTSLEPELQTVTPFSFLSAVQVFA